MSPPDVSSSGFITSSQFHQDKAEYSPNSRAHCRSCHLLIHKGAVRVGICVFHEQYKHWGFNYYHDHCLTEWRKDDLQLPLGGTIQDELLHQTEHEEELCHLLEDRYVLLQDLRHLRMALANEIGRAPYYVFPDTTLNDLVVKMPKNKTELLLCSGIGRQKAMQFGAAILAVIKAYQKRTKAAGYERMASQKHSAGEFLSSASSNTEVV